MYLLALRAERRNKTTDINNDKKILLGRLIQNKLTQDLPRCVGNVKESLPLEKTNSKRSKTEKEMKILATTVKAKGTH